jgi:hypothetical protein
MSCRLVSVHLSATLCAVADKGQYINFGAYAMLQPPDIGGIVEIPKVGGLHYRYERCAA